MADIRILNPTNKTEVFLSGLISISILAVGNIWIYLEDGFDWTGIIIGIVVALFVFLRIGGRLEIFTRPKEVEFIDSDIVLHQRLWRRPVFVPWSDVSRVSHMVVIKPSKGGKVINSYLGVVEKKRYTSPGR